ncbi:MAG: T9SS type A sorting domain-containing protein [Bacteroidia bacterium]
MKTKNSSLLLLALTFSSVLSATIKTSVIDGNWSNPSIWIPAGVPSSTDDVVISSNVTANSMNTISNPTFTIDAGASFVVSTGTLTFSNNSISNSGTIVAQSLWLNYNFSFFNYGQIIVNGVFDCEGPINNTTGGSICAGHVNVVDMFTNAGSISMDSLFNITTILNSGRMCISNTYFNAGSIIGSGDICDATPNGLNDLPGTIGSTITQCQVGPCVSCVAPASVDDQNSLAVSSVNVFPNPGNGIYTVQISGTVQEYTLEVYDLAGRELIQQQNQAAYGQFNTQIDISSYAAGSYILRISAGGASQFVKLEKAE